jgi:uncharacterized protein involved in exopolysaccharide biosynthesis
MNESSNILVVILKHRRFLIITAVFTAVLSGVVSFLIPEKFKSTVVVFATQQHSFGEQLLEEQKKEDVLAYGEEEDAERLMQILNSEQIKSKVIEQFNLWEVYEISPTEAGANALIAKEYNDNVTASLTKFGGIEIEVLDHQPKRAKEMADAIAIYADSVSNRMRSERAADALAYAERTLAEQEKSLRVMEDSINHLRKLGVYDYKDQIEALMKDYSSALGKGNDDRAQLIKREMDHLSRYGTTFNKLDADIESTNEKLAILRKRHELMRVDVQSNLPAKFVLDSATEADKKSYPIRWLIVVVSTFSVILFSVFALLFNNYWKEVKKTGAI